MTGVGVEAAPFTGELSVHLIDIPTRLRFLENLLERPAFDGSAVLRAIVQDYRRTLRALQLQEQMFEEESQR